MSQPTYTSFGYSDDARSQLIDVPEMPHAGEPYEIPLDPGDETKAETLLEELPLISLHEHPAYQPAEMEDRPEYVRSGRVRTPYDLLETGPLDAAFVGMMGVKTWDDAVRNLGMRRCDYVKSELVDVIETAEQLRSVGSDANFGAVLTVETSQLVGTDVDRLDVLYGLGVRSMGLTYSESNAVGTGLADQNRDGGLTSFGEDVITRMNELGILIDASHASDRTTLDAVEASDDPIILSHNGARALNDIDRLDPDEILEAVADAGGVIGIQAAPHNTASPDHHRHSIDSYMDHFEYLIDLVGIDHVAFGPDVSWGDHLELHRYFGKDLSQYPDWVNLDIDYVEGLENPNEAWENIVRWLVGNGYSDEEIRQVTSENIIRVAADVW